MTIEDGMLLERVEKLEKQVKRMSTIWRWRFAYPLMAVFISMFVAVGISITYTGQAINNNEQTWCELVGSLDKQYQRTPPPNTSGQVFAATIHHIAIKFHCH